MTWFTWSLLAAAFAALTAILAKAGLAGTNSNVATAIRTTVAMLLAWAIVAGTGVAPEVARVPTRTLLVLALSGLATGLSWLCYFQALQLGEASRVAPVDKLSVVLVIALAAIFLGEPVTIAKLIGGALIAAGAVILAVY